MKRNRVSRIGCIMAVFVFSGLLLSCASTKPYLPLDEFLDEEPDAEVLGEIEIEFFAQGGNGYTPVTNIIKEAAYENLLAEAKKQYTGNIDVADIWVDFIKWRGITVFSGADYHAEGKVVLIGGGGSSGGGNAALYNKAGIEGALARSVRSLTAELPKDTSVAVISIASTDRDAASFAIDELEYQLVASKLYRMVDRKTLDTIRAEQNFQVSGEVSDSSAVSIGNMLGANIVITGAITGSGSSQRLTLKALDVKTALIITMTREQF